MRFSIASIQQRLREGRLVALVVPAAAVAIHVDHHVALELAAEIHRQAHHLGHGFGIFAVDVEDRDLQHLGHVGGVGASSGLRTGGVVKPIWLLTTTCSVPPICIGLQLAQVERFLNDPFAGERRVAVNQQAPGRGGARMSSTRSCLARTRPTATGLTNSKWLGLKQSDRWTFCPLEVVQSVLWPR